MQLPQDFKEKEIADSLLSTCMCNVTMASVVKMLDSPQESPRFDLPGLSVFMLSLSWHIACNTSLQPISPIIEVPQQ